MIKLHQDLYEKADGELLMIDTLEEYDFENENLIIEFLKDYHNASDAQVARFKKNRVIMLPAETYKNSVGITIRPFFEFRRED